MDNTCRLMVVYTQSSRGTLWTVGENFLRYVLTNKNVFTDVKSPYFKFAYANGEYSTGADHRPCVQMSSAFNVGIKGCGCVFLIDGGRKMSVEFNG